MIFTHLCRAVAVLGAVYSAFMFWVGYNSGRNILDTAVAIQQSDMSFRHGATVLLGSIVLGTLAEISFSLRKS